MWLTMSLPLRGAEESGLQLQLPGQPGVQLGCARSTVRPGEDMMNERFQLESDARPFSSAEDFRTNSHVTNHKSSKDAETSEQSDHFGSRTRNLSLCLLGPVGYLVRGQL